MFPKCFVSNVFEPVYGFVKIFATTKKWREPLETKRKFTRDYIVSYLC